MQGKAQQKKFFFLKNVKRFNKRVVNVHPSLLPLFSGLVDLEVHKAVLNSGVDKTGCTLHLVTELVDKGQILIQQECAIKRESDTPERLKQRVQELEHQAILHLVDDFSKNRVLRPIK